MAQVIFQADWNIVTKNCPFTGVEYVIPPLWKRLIAEAIDFLLLFVIKLAVTFAAVDAFDLLWVLEDSYVIKGKVQFLPT